MAAAGDSCWAQWGGRALTALRPVLARLQPRELARAAQVCRTWRHAAADPALWRAALARHAHIPPATLRAIARVRAQAGAGAEWWRAEAALAAGAWRDGGTLVAADGAPLVHADLSECGTLLALAAEDGTITAWAADGDAWQRVWAARPGAGRWARCESVSWAPGGARLLARGGVALAARGEAAVLSAGAGRVRARAGCSVACWVSPRAFLALELSRAAPQHYVTAVWIYAAEQENWSEDEGIAEPLFRIYNEAQTHISHAIVVETPQTTDSVGSFEEQYYRCIGAFPDTSSERIYSDNEEDGERAVLVCACGQEGGVGGEQRAVAAFALHRRSPPPLRARAQGDLRARRLQQQLRPRPHQEDEQLEEGVVRALCCPPGAVAALGARVLGLAGGTGGARCVWAFTAEGAACCLALPHLHTLRRLLPPAGTPPPPVPQYCWGAASRRLVARPLPGGVACWCLRSGAPVRAPPCPGGAVCCLVSPRWPPELLLLTADVLQVWRALVPPESDS